MLALDHRGSFETYAGTKEKSTLIAHKKSIIASLYSQFSGTLLDPDYGLPAYRAYCTENAIEKPKPFLLCIEASGYEQTGNERITKLKYRASELKELGASGVKLLIFLNPASASAATQCDIAKDVLTQCRKEGLPFFLEIVTYPADDQSYVKSDAILSSLRLLAEKDIMPDVWKLEFPGSAADCHKITQTANDTPWILLTRGEPFDSFCHSLSIAAQEGAVGFLAGRSVWQEFNEQKTDEQKRIFYEKTIPARFAKICSIVNETGHHLS